MDRPLEATDHYVLVIDDDADLRESIGLVLDTAGHAFTTAVDGADGLARLRRDDRPPPCLVLLDLMMPRMSGFELRAVMRADPALASIPVIVITGAGGLADRRISEIDAEILRKPIEMKRLLDAVRQHCRPTLTSDDDASAE